MDDVKRQVRETGSRMADAVSLKPQREAAGRAIDSAKKTVRDTVSRYSDRAKKAMSGRSRSR